mgnify:CR=1 FL=1
MRDDDKDWGIHQEIKRVRSLDSKQRTSVLYDTGNVVSISDYNLKYAKLYRKTVLSVAIVNFGSCSETRGWLE